jgi:hypothetical protein
MGRFFMPEIEKVITVAGEWVKKAENDLKNAAFTLEMDDECPTDTVCFHAQQVVEKYLKALLVLKGIPFPKSHNIEDIIALLPPSSYRNGDVHEIITADGDWSSYPIGNESNRTCLATFYGVWVWGQTQCC